MGTVVNRPYGRLAPSDIEKIESRVGAALRRDQGSIVTGLTSAPMELQYAADGRWTRQRAIQTVHYGAMLTADLVADYDRVRLVREDGTVAVLIAVRAAVGAAFALLVGSGANVRTETWHDASGITLPDGRIGIRPECDVVHEVVGIGVRWIGAPDDDPPFAIVETRTGLPITLTTADMVMVTPPAARWRADIVVDADAR